MICILALVVFGILGIFSATHRKLALEAFECVFKKIRLQPCDSGLDKRLKSQITGKLMRKHPKMARFGYRHFEAVSLILTIIMIVSFVYSGLGIYNFVAYGNCNGESSQEACVYEGLGNAFKIDVDCESPLCQNEYCTCKEGSGCQEKEGDICKENCYGSVIK
ncbi:MAG: hypothetical protein GOU99_02125 [Candidatus Altiarchaeota archaeon]|nr:hypothetical protein [Candidatus Altiarchaeota archaeon]